MKTEKQINELIAVLKIELKDSKSEAETKRLSNKINKLLQCIRYLETSPDENYLSSEKQRLENIIESKLKQFDFWCKNSPEARGNSIQEQKKIYAKLFDFAGMKRKIKTIKFILK